MARLQDDQLHFILSLDAKGVQGEINNLEVATSKLEKEYTELNSTLSKTEKELAPCREYSCLTDIYRAAQRAARYWIYVVSWLVFCNRPSIQKHPHQEVLSLSLGMCLIICNFAGN